MYTLYLPSTIYEITDGSVFWWAQARLEEEAIQYAVEYEAYGDNIIEKSSLRAKVLNQEVLEKMSFFDEDFDKTVSFALYLKINQDCLGVFCCSEW